MPRYLLTATEIDTYKFACRKPLLDMMRDKGYEVHVAIPSQAVFDQVKGWGFTPHLLSLTRDSLNPLKERKTLQSFKNIQTEVNPDIAHHFTSKAVLYGSIAGAKICIATVTGIGFSLTGGMSGIKGKAFATLSGALHRKAFRNCNTVIFQNADDMHVFLDQKLLPKEKAVLIQGSGVDMNQNHPSKRVSHEGPVRFVFLSRLIAPKGIYELVEASMRLHNELPGQCEVVLAGATDPQNPKSITEGELKKWVDEGILKYVGIVPNAVTAFESADVAILPSYWLEGLPRSMVEAAAMGLPVITTTSSGCKDSVVNGVTGFAVPPKDADGLFEAMKKLANEPELRTKMGMEGRKFVENRYSVEAVLEQTWRVYESAM